MYILGTAFGAFLDARCAQMMVGFLSLRGGGRKAWHAPHRLRIRPVVGHHLRLDLPPHESTASDNATNQGAHGIKVMTPTIPLRLSLRSLLAAFRSLTQENLHGPSILFYFIQRLLGPLHFYAAVCARPGPTCLRNITMVHF
jgi:hypothetical protein